MFIESWNNEMIGVGGEKQRYKLTPGIRSSSGTRNSNKLLVDGGCCTQVLRGVGEEEGEDSFVEWRPCKWRAGALNPRKLECVYTGPGNFSRNPPHTQKAIAHLSNMNLLYRFEPYLPIFVSPLLSFSSFLLLLSSFEIQVESHYSKNFTLSPSSSSFSSCTKRYQVPEDNTSRGLYRVETYHGHERINGDRYSRPIS